MKKGIGPRGLGAPKQNRATEGVQSMARKTGSPARKDDKKSKTSSLPGYTSDNQSRMEKSTYHTDVLDAGKSRTAVYESTKGNNSDQAKNSRERADREVGRTKRNYRISKMGGESLEAGQYEMGAMKTKTHSFRPKGANKLQPTFKPEKKRITPGSM